MSAPIITKYLDEAEYEAWQDFVVDSPQGMVYSLPAYLDALCTAVGGSFRILAATQNDEIVGGVAFYQRRSLFGTAVNSRLLLYYNSILLRDYATKYPSQLTSRHLKTQAALEAELSKAGFASMQLKNHHSLTDVRLFQQNGWQARPSYTYVVAISDLESAWDRIEQNLRRLIKRCEKQGIQFTEDEDFDSFYHMHAETHERKGAPLYMPRKQFKTFFERLRAEQLCRMYHARLAEGKSISAQLVLAGPCAMTHTVSAAADEEYLKSGATAFLRWKAFQHLAELGYSSNDLTDAALNPVTHFKSQLGGDLVISLILTAPERFMFRMAQNSSAFISRTKHAITRRVKKLIMR
jgi:hypothetical protein